MTTTHVGLAITIEGLPVALSSVPALVDGTAALVCVEHDSVSAGETRISLATAVEEGASFSCSLVDTSPVLRQLFAARSHPVTHLAADIDDATTAITVGSTSLLPSSGEVYIGAETIAYTGTTPTSLVGVTRAAHGSTAQRHIGGPRIGAADGIYLAPSSWMGRRLRLHLVHDDGSIEAVETYRMTSPPGFVDGARWTLSASTMVAWYRDRLIYTGLDDVPTTDDPRLFDGERVHVEDAATFAATGIEQTHVQLTFAGGSVLVGRKGSVSVPGKRVDVLGPDLVAPSFTETEPFVYPSTTTTAYGFSTSSARHVWATESTAVYVALALLCSRTGDGSNGLHDVLPGVVDEWRMGAGIDEADIDIASFATFAGGTAWRVYLDEPMTVADLMAELCLSVGATWGTDAQGRITIRRIAERIPPTSPLVLDDDIRTIEENDALTLDESAIRAIRRMDASWDPLHDEYDTSSVVVDAGIRRRYPHVDAVEETTSKMLVVARGGPPRPGQRLLSRNGVSGGDIDAIIRRRQLYDARPAALYTAVCIFAARTVRPGDVVEIENAAVVDGEGGNLTAKRMLVLGRRVDYVRGTVTLSLRLADRGYLVAPSAVSTSWVGLVATVPAGDGDDFAAGWPVRVYHMAGTVVVQSAVATVQATTPTTVEVKAGLPFTPTAGDIITVERDTDTAPSASGHRITDAIYQTPDSGRYADGTDGTRWA